MKVYVVLEYTDACTYVNSVWNNEEEAESRKLCLVDREKYDLENVQIQEHDLQGDKWKE